MDNRKEEWEKQRTDRVGEIRKNRNGTLMEIIDYRSYRDITIQFKDDNGAIVKTRYDAFINMNVRNPYDRVKYGIGYLGYDIRENKCYTSLKSYNAWNDMIKRCYSTKEIRKRRNTYIDCTVCEEWHNYINFKKWYDENYWEVENDWMCLDKDILYKDNKIYSPKTCIIVPNRINVLFIKANKIRGDYPIGVSYNKSHKCFTASCHKIKCGVGKLEYVGGYSTPKEAFNAYKKIKESYIKQVADEYKSKYPNFPQRLYDAMYSYEVEITD